MTNPLRDIAEGIVSLPIIDEQAVTRELDARLAEDGPMTICKGCGGKGYEYSDPDHHLLTCGDCEGKGEKP